MRDPHFSASSAARSSGAWIAGVIAALLMVNSAGNTCADAPPKTSNRLAPTTTGAGTRKGQSRVRVVAIDAGHGGQDTGARGRNGAREKDVTLAVAHRLAEALSQTSGVKPVLVRSGDEFVPLHERYRIAERAHADLFVSIHCNSSPRRGAGSGTEVYFLSLGGAADQASKDLADRENAADLVGGVPPEAEDDLVDILYDVKRNSALQQSQMLAATVLDHVARGPITSRGVKQAGFAVLKSVEFPSILVETAFINNAAEARLLRNRTFQARIARQIASGIKSYLSGSGAIPKLPKGVLP